jgi:hypothetical protein
MSAHTLVPVPISGGDDDEDGGVVVMVEKHRDWEYDQQHLEAHKKAEQPPEAGAGARAGAGRCHSHEKVGAADGYDEAILTIFLDKER